MDVDGGTRANVDEYTADVPAEGSLKGNDGETKRGENHSPGPSVQVKGRRGKRDRPQDYPPLELRFSDFDGCVLPGTCTEPVCG